MLGEKYTVTQAKRIFGFVGTGSLLGAVAGAAVARVIVAEGSPSALVLVGGDRLRAHRAGPGACFSSGPRRDAAVAVD